MTPEDLEGLLNQYTTNAINNIFTSIPCRVTAVNLAIQSVDVEILVDRVDTSGTSHKHSIITDVPLMFPASRSSAFTFPVNVNDTVLCVFSQRSIDRIKQGGTSSGPPLTYRKYSRNDAIAIPGIFPFNGAVNNPSRRNLSHNVNDTVVSHNVGTGNECEVRLDISGNISITSPGTVTVNSENAIVNADSTINGDLIVNGNAAFNGSSVTHNGQDIGEVHTHSGVDTGSGTSGPPNS